MSRMNPRFGEAGQRPGVRMLGKRPGQRPWGERPSRSKNCAKIIGYAFGQGAIIGVSLATIFGGPIIGTSRRFKDKRVRSLGKMCSRTGLVCGFWLVFFTYIRGGCS